jgi:hypothetical protein
MDIATVEKIVNEAVAVGEVAIDAFNPALAPVASEVAGLISGLEKAGELAVVLKTKAQSDDALWAQIVALNEAGDVLIADAEAKAQP